MVPLLSTGMTQLAPATVTAPRGGAFALLLGGVAGGFGLAALALAMTDPTERHVAALPPLQHAQAEPRTAGDASREWPPLFGTPAEPEPEPVSAEVETGPPPLAPLDARLRGLALDEEGGWALIEQGDQVLLVRPGSALTEDYTVDAILRDGVLIASREGSETLGFDEDGVNEPVASRMQTSLQRAIMTGQHEFDQMPMPRPPPDYVPGPGFSGPSNL